MSERVQVGPQQWTKRVGLALWLSAIALSLSISLPALATAQPPTAQDSSAIKEAMEKDHGRKALAMRNMRGQARRLAQEYFGIPEYHDEQALPTGPASLGPVAYLFASPFLATFRAPFELYEQGAPGALVAMVYVDAPDGTALPPTYVALGLRGGLNCVWMTISPPPGPPNWYARVTQATPDAASEKICVKPPTPSGTVLRVYRRQRGGFTGFDDYPASARFGEATNGQPLLGFKCFDHWCEVGPNGVTPLDPHLTTGTRAQTINGWHDDQRLAVRAADGTLRPGPRATLIPDPQIGTRATNDFATWVPVARLFLHSAPAPNSKYARWGLSAGWHLIESRLGASNQFEVQVRRIPGTNPNGPPMGAPTRWWHVERHVHQDAPAPPMVRFRWTAFDDGIWYPCGNSCCLADGGIQ